MGKNKDSIDELRQHVEHLYQRLSEQETEILVIKAELARLRKDTPINQWPNYKIGPDYKITC